MPDELRKLLHQEVRHEIDRCSRVYPELLEELKRRTDEFLEKFPSRTMEELTEAQIAWSNLMSVHHADCSSYDAKLGAESLRRQTRH